MSAGSANKKSKFTCQPDEQGDEPDFIDLNTPEGSPEKKPEDNVSVLKDTNMFKPGLHGPGWSGPSPERHEMRKAYQGVYGQVQTVYVCVWCVCVCVCM